MHKDRWRPIGPDGGETAVRIRSRFSSNSGEALRQVALAGAGIVMQSEWLLRHDLETGALVQVLPRHAPPARPAHLVYLPDRQPTPKLQRFIQFVLQRLGPAAVPATRPSRRGSGSPR